MRNQIYLLCYRQLHAYDPLWCLIESGITKTAYYIIERSSFGVFVPTKDAHFQDCLDIRWIKITLSSAYKRVLELIFINNERNRMDVR